MRAKQGVAVLLTTMLVSSAFALQEVNLVRRDGTLVLQVPEGESVMVEHVASSGEILSTSPIVTQRVLKSSVMDPAFWGISGDDNEEAPDIPVVTWGALNDRLADLLSRQVAERVKEILGVDPADIKSTVARQHKIVDCQELGLIYDQEADECHDATQIECGGIIEGLASGFVQRDSVCSGDRTYRGDACVVACDSDNFEYAEAEFHCNIASEFRAIAWEGEAHL
jgi:hypothetical protein